MLPRQLFAPSQPQHTAPLPTSLSSAPQPLPRHRQRFVAAIDTSSWPEWITFMQVGVIKSEVTLCAPKSGDFTVGTLFRETPYLDGNGKGKPTSNDIKMSKCGELDDGRKGLRVAWIFVNESFIYRSERVQEYVQMEDGKTAFRDFITFGEASSWLLKLMFAAKLAARWNDYGGDLKKLLQLDEFEKSSSPNSLLPHRLMVIRSRSTA